MSSRLRTLWIGAMMVVALAARARAEDTPPPKDEVYQYEREGRRVFTNAGSMQVDGAALRPMDLPELSPDLGSATQGQLQLLDNSVQRAHDELQQGTRCRAIRASLRVPLRSFLMRGHLRELGVGLGLLMLAILVASIWRGPLRKLMPVVPVIGSIYLGYATYVRIDHRLGSLREGLRACTSDLPPQLGSVDSVRGRLEQASTLQSTIERAYAQRASFAESAARMR